MKLKNFINPYIVADMVVIACKNSIHTILEGIKLIIKTHNNIPVIFSDQFVLNPVGENTDIINRVINYATQAIISPNIICIMFF